FAHLDQHSFPTRRSSDLELKENEFKDLFADSVSALPELVPVTQIETDLSILIPEEYVKNISERLSLYTRLDNIKTEDELQSFQRSEEHTSELQSRENLVC